MTAKLYERACECCESKALFATHKHVTLMQYLYVRRQENEKLIRRRWSTWSFQM